MPVEYDEGVGQERPAHRRYGLTFPVFARLSVLSTDRRAKTGGGGRESGEGDGGVGAVG